MVAVFFVLGALTIGGGAFWVFVTFKATSIQTISEGAVLLLATPGVGAIVLGLLFVAIGGGLHRLDRILRFTRETSRTLKALAEQRDTPK